MVIRLVSSVCLEISTLTPILSGRISRLAVPFAFDFAFIASPTGRKLEEPRYPMSTNFRSVQTPTPQPKDRASKINVHHIIAVAFTRVEGLGTVMKSMGTMQGELFKWSRQST